MSYLTLQNKYCTYTGKMVTNITPPVWPVAGLFSRWTYENNLNDSVNGYTLNVNSPRNYESGKIGLATHSNALSGDMYLLSGGTTSFVNKTTWTVNFWVKLPASASLIDKRTTFMCIGDNNVYSFQTEVMLKAGGDNVNWLEYDAIEPTVLKYHIHRGGSYDILNLDLGYDFSGDWHMVTLTSAHKVYFDGSFLGEYIYATSLWLNNILFAITPDSSVSTYLNWFDNTYVYDRAITGEEISQLWNNGNGV